MKTPSSSTARKRREAKPASAPETLAPDEPLPFDDDGIKRVQDIIRNARATWFALLGALVFASVTLASVKDISFFVNTVETKLPIVGISVPVVSFFWAGSMLTAALYAYFHLYLELLWQALGDAPARINGKPLADRIEPWIVAEAALRLRDRLRGAHGEERAGRKRAMAAVSDVVSFGLVWLFGLAVFISFWWRSMPAHEPLLSLFLGAVLIATFWVSLVSFISASNHLSESETSWRWRPVFAIAALAIVGLTVVWTWIDPWASQAKGTVFYKCEVPQRDAGRSFCPDNIRIDWLRPVVADLRKAVFTEKPNDWQSKVIAETEFRARWCKERVKPKCANPLDPINRTFESALEKNFQAAWKERWKAQLASFPKPELNKVDFRGAYMTLSALEGADLSAATLDGADLSLARLDGADLSNASLVGANLSDAALDGADLTAATLVGAYLSSARLDGAVLTGATLDGAVLSYARLDGAVLSLATLDGALLRFARLNGAVLTSARLDGADLTGATLDGADLTGATLDGADLSFARAFGMPTKPFDLTSASLRAASLRGSALRFARLSAENLAQVRNFGSSFGDASVELPPGSAWPCQWGATALSEAEYFGRWGGWLASIGESAFFLYSDAYPPILPPPECIPGRRPQ